MLIFASPIHSHVKPLLEENIRYTRWVKKMALEGLEFMLFKEALLWQATLRDIGDQFLMCEDDEVFLINEKNLPLYTHPYQPR